MKLTYPSYFPRAIAGQREGSIQWQRVIALRNKRGTKQVITLTVPATPDSDSEYSVTIDAWATARFKTDADATQTELQTGLLNAIRTNPGFGPRVTADTSGTNIVLTSTDVRDTHTIVTSGTGLTWTQTTASAQPDAVPIGRFVGRASGDTDYGIAYLPTVATDGIIGITAMIKDIERTDIRYSTESPTTYKANEVMDVVDRTGDSGGIWVECVESDIVPTDGLYVAVASGSEGMATKNNTGTIDVTAKGKFRSKPSQTPEGRWIVLVEFNI